MPLGSSPSRGKKVFKVALIGCGGRGNGAAEITRGRAVPERETGWKLEVQFVATGDWFPDKAKGAGQR